MVRAFENHPLRFAIAVSVALHVLLLLLGNTPYKRYVPADRDSIPTLQLWVTSSTGEPVETRASASAERLAERTGIEPELLAVSAPRVEPPPDFGSASGEQEPPSEPPPDLIADSGNTTLLASADVEPQAVDALQSSSVITTRAESAWSEPAAPAQATVEAPPTVIAPIPADEQQRIARKIMRWVHRLEHLDDTTSQLSWTQNGRPYMATFRRQPASSITGHEGATVEITAGEQGNETRTHIHLRRLAFSHFTQMVDRWDSNVQLHDDEVIGRFHSNTKLTIGYSPAVSPRFRGKVTTAAQDYTLASWARFKPRSSIFQAGFEAGVGRIDLPQRFMETGSPATTGDVQIHTFERPGRITFYSDGTYGWQPLDRSSAEVISSVGNDPLFLVGATGVGLHVRGIVKGTVLVYSPERIMIEDDLTYATNPRLVPDARDYVGLVCDKLIEIADPEVTGPGDLFIEAALFAREGFNVRREFVRGEPATLHIYGSLTAGTISATEPRYATRIEFDPRFEHTRPPGFPTTNRFELAHWDGNWVAPR